MSLISLKNSLFLYTHEMYVLNPPNLSVFDLSSFHGQNTLVASFNISKLC